MNTSETASRVRPPVSHRTWLRGLLVLVFFVPPLVERGYDPAATTEIIRAVLADPWANTYGTFLVAAKLALLGVIVVPFLGGRGAGRVVIAYYTAVLLVVAVFQNVATTPRFGFVWLAGNTLVQFVVVGWCIADVLGRRTRLGRPRRDRWWLLAPMTLALLMPYAVVAGRIIPSLASVAINEAGLTYCMITPVVLGTLLLFDAGVDRRTLSIASYVGLMFGTANLLTWFVLDTANWWMGVLHVPLVVVSIYGLLAARIGSPAHPADPEFVAG